MNAIMININEISNALDFYYFLLRIDSAEILSLLNQSAEEKAKPKHNRPIAPSAWKEKSAEKPRKKIWRTF